MLRSIIQGQKVISARNVRLLNTSFRDNKLIFSSGVWGNLSESSILLRCGDNVLHASVNSGRINDVLDAFLPLTVDFRTRDYAKGLIPQARNRRELNNSTESTLAARCIDRAIRPLFPKGYVREVQLTVTQHSWEENSDPVVAAVNAASFALLQSRQPWRGPVGCVRVGLVDGALKANPTAQEMKRSPLDLLYAGVKDRTLMIEVQSSQLPEDQMVAALSFANEAVQQVIRQQLEQSPLAVSLHLNTAVLNESSALPAALALPASTVQRDQFQPFTISDHFKEQALSLGYSEALALYTNGSDSKDTRGHLEGAFRAQLYHKIQDLVSTGNISDGEPGEKNPLKVTLGTEYVMQRAFRDALLSTEGSAVVRSDGRRTDELRAVGCAVDVLPGAVHGSAYFARGETHVACAVTLGSKFDALGAETAFTNKSSTATLVAPTAGELERESDSVKKPQYFFLHYDFPPYSTGELGSVTGVNRRMVGHGALAEKALMPVMPDFARFPYAVRAFCECTSSNGSSSMASVCAGTLALLDAGVPLKAPVAGVSVGLVTDPSYSLFAGEEGAGESGRYSMLLDILGSEDHNGDMDFKVAGTKTGITAIQLDVKLAGGVPLPLLTEALSLARTGRLSLLAQMEQQGLRAPRSAVKPHAPCAELVQFDPERGASLLGPRGEMLSYIESLYRVEIDVDLEKGEAYLFGRDATSLAEARGLVEDIAMVLEEQTVVAAEVMEVRDFGLIVRLNRAQQGLLHVSELTHDPELLKRPLGDWIHKGDRLRVKVTSVDKMTGTVKVSRKALLARDSLPDHFVPLEPLTTPTSSPGFPLTPPRNWSKDFFRDSVVSKEEIRKSMHITQEPPNTKPKQSTTSNTTGHKARHHEKSRNESSKASNSPSTGNRSKRHQGQQGNQKKSQRSVEGDPESKPLVSPEGV